MSKAEALKAYCDNCRYHNNCAYLNRGMESKCLELDTYSSGYEQAEKDLALAWVNVNDRLPKEEFDDGYTFVFVIIRLDKETYRFDVDYIRNGKWELHPNDNITHWMPIPPLISK